MIGSQWGSNYGDSNRNQPWAPRNTFTVGQNNRKWKCGISLIVRILPIDRNCIVSGSELISNNEEFDYHYVCYYRLHTHPFSLFSAGKLLWT